MMRTFKELKLLNISEIVMNEGIGNSLDLGQRYGKSMNCLPIMGYATASIMASFPLKLNFSPTPLCINNAPIGD